jgi:hypothetical protein
MITWFIRKHTSVALSMDEAEYKEVCSTSSKTMWLWNLLSRLFDLELQVTCIWCDNHSCVRLSKNLVFHENSKHVEIKYQYIRDMVHKGAMKLQYVATYE